jgi:acyl-CoA synthetase (AMP-forming)/AMP-acid ligase II
MEVLDQLVILLRAEDVVMSAVRARLAGYKVPRIVISAAVPRGPNGKIIYPEARRLVDQQRSLVSQELG